MTQSRRGARPAVLIAGGVGLIHAAFSFFWALGGMWLLPTVGAWAVDLVQRSPTEAGILLGLIGLIKAAAALVPVAVEYGRLPFEPFWRTICWIGGTFLLLYGAANVIVSNAVLLGLVRADGGYDAAATIGHAALWDPLFVIWGGALVTWLVRSRRRRTSPA